MDKTWPEDECCRIYKLNEFRGDSKDFCTDAANGKSSSVPSGTTKNFELQQGWDNRMMSWKCGRNTAALFCAEPDGNLCELDIDYGESAGGGAESQDTGLNRQLSLLTLTHYEPSINQAITVFELSECHGYSAVLWQNREYGNTEVSLTTGSNIGSVMVPEGSDWQVDLYPEEDFGGEPFIVRHDVSVDKRDDRNDCLNVADTHAGQVMSIRFSPISYDGPIPEETGSA